MKKLFPLLLILSLLLTACGAAAQPEQSDFLPPVSETDEAGDSSADESGTEADDPNAEVDELPVLEDVDPAPVPEENTPAALSDETVTLDGISSYLRVTLPDGWTWEQAAGTPEGTAYALYPKDDPAFKAELHWWPKGMGMCGTGVTFEDYTLPDGQTATLATEESGEDLMWTLILPESPDSFSVQFCVPMSLYEAHRADLQLLLSTLQQGMKADLDVVQTETVAG